MAVDLYLYDEGKRLRGAALWGVTKLIHDERDFMLTVELASGYGVVSGDYVGFTCADGRFRLFRVDKTETDVGAGMTTVTATEAAVAELANSIVREIRLDETDAQTAVRETIAGSDFVLGKTAAGRKGQIQKIYAQRWKVLREIESTCNVRIIPHYEMRDGKITAKVVDIEEKTYRRIGRILQRETDATNVRITTSGCSIARLYGVGRSTGTQDPPESVTFKDVVWSRAAGDPMDKPAGQDYLEDPEMIARGITHEDVFEDRNITDPDELIRETHKVFLERRRPKVSGIATAFDVSYMPGYEHKAVELYDILDVPMENGGTAEGKVIDIQRDYIRPDLTQIVLGEEKDAGGIIRKVAQLKSEAQSLRASASAAASRYIENKHLIQLNANRILLNAEEILAQAERIRLNVQKIDETTGRVSQAELLLNGDGTSAQAGLVARMLEQEGATEAMSEAFSAYKAEIGAAIAQIGSRISGAEGEIGGVSEALATFKSTTESAVAGISARVGENEAAITTTATNLGSRIDLKADKTYVDKLLADEVSAIRSEIGQLTGGTVQASHLHTQNLTATNTVRLAGHTCAWKTQKVVTGINFSKETITIPGGNGVNYVAIGGVSLRYNTEDINYFSYN